ncbi:MAG: hypothetical protein ABID79_03635 [Elusimicrobiota bacterium]
MKNEKITIKVPGSCGELAQGMLDGNYFHITCPINLFSYISVKSSKKVETLPNKWKSRKAAEKTLKFLGERKNLKIQIDSQLPTCCGMASSTADIVGVCLGVAKLLEKQISDDNISEVALSIEPSDGIMFKGIVLFDHRKGELKEYLGSPPKIKILVIDLGIRENTIRFNKMNFSKEHLYNGKKIEKAVELIKKGIKEKNYQ